MKRRERWRKVVPLKILKYEYIGKFKKWRNKRNKRKGEVRAHRGEISTKENFIINVQGVDEMTDSSQTYTNGPVTSAIQKMDENWWRIILQYMYI